MGIWGDPTGILIGLRGLGVGGCLIFVVIAEKIVVAGELAAEGFSVDATFLVIFDGVGGEAIMLL